MVLPDTGRSRPRTRPRRAQPMGLRHAWRRPRAGEPLHAEHLLRSVTQAIDLAVGDHEPARWHFRLDSADYLIESDGRPWSLGAGAPPRGATTSGRMAARSGLAGKGGKLIVPRLHLWADGTSSGPTTCTAVRGAPPLCKKVVNSQRTTKARRSHPLPLLTYSRLGGLRQDPGRAAESAVGPRRTKTWGTTCVCCCRPMGDAVTNRWRD